MAELKTKKSTASVDAYLSAVEPKQRGDEARIICALMAKVTKANPVMWGTSIVGFGHYHYVYESGREGDWMLCGFSPRKQALTLYIMSGFVGHEALLAQLGKCKIGKSCLYIKQLIDVDMKVLEKLIRASVAYIKENNPDVD